MNTEYRILGKEKWAQMVAAQVQGADQYDGNNGSLTAVAGVVFE